MEQTFYIKGRIYRKANPASPASPQLPRVFVEKYENATYSYWAQTTQDTDRFLCLGEEQTAEDLGMMRVSPSLGFFVKFLRIHDNAICWVEVYRVRNRDVADRRFRLVEARATDK